MGAAQSAEHLARADAAFRRAARTHERAAQLHQEAAALFGRQGLDEQAADERAKALDEEDRAVADWNRVKDKTSS